MQPTGYRFAAPDGARFSGQQQERRLKGVFGILGMTSDSPTYTQNHRPVTIHQSGKRFLFLQCGKSLQEARIGAIDSS